MPEFSPGEIKTAIVTMRNPTGIPFDYLAELYMGTDLALMASNDFHLEADESKDISLSVTMPSVSGTYPVYIGVFSAGESIGLYRAVEDISIAIQNLVLEITAVNGVNVNEAYYLFDVYCKISNPTNAPISGWVKCYGQRMGDIGKTYERNWSGPDYPSAEYPLTLAPGETQTIISPAIARSSVNPAWANQNFPWKYYTYYEWDQVPAYFWLEDDKGNKSAVFTLTF